MYLETQRLILRRMGASDLADVLEYAPDPERCRMMGAECPRDGAEARESFAWMLSHEKRFYAIVLRSENKCIGHLIVKNFPDVASLPELSGLVGRSLAFCIARDYRRQGYASEAVSAVLEYLFEKRGVDYVNSGYFTFNVPSMRLHGKLGFEPIAETAMTLPGGETATGVETVIMNPALTPRRRPGGTEK